MTTLTETALDLADCHTTFYYLGAKPPLTAPMPLGTVEDYGGLYQTVAAPARVTYSDVTGGNSGSLMVKLSPVYRNSKYWRRYLGSGEYDLYHESAWDSIMPIEVSLSTRVEFIPNVRFNFKVSPVPRVLLYPFGWSAWLSLRLTGDHTLGELSAFLQHIFAAKAFHLGPDPAPPDQQPSAYTLREVFSHVARGVRVDAFGGNKTKDFDSQEMIAVTTVLGKHGGSLSLGALKPAVQEEILRIVKPEGPAPKEPLLDYVFRRSEDELREYVVMNDHKRFIWLEHLLVPEGRNYEHLRCYHNNTFHSLIQARNLLELLVMAGKQKTISDPLVGLVQTAIGYLESPNYKNASLREFLKDTAITNAIKKLKKSDKSEEGNA